MHTLRGSDQTLSMASRHRAMASQDSQRSGIAASAISFGGESLRLSQFPPPPTEIPTTPSRSEFAMHTPTRANFSPRDTPPGTPQRGLPHQLPSHRMDPPTSVISRPLPLPERSRSRGRASNASSPQGSTRSRPLPRHPLQANASTHPPHATPTRQPSSSDWQEGASSVDLDPDEDRLLSTSFITSLLSSTELNGNRSYSPISFRTMTLPPSHVSDALSCISDSSYLPPSRLTGSPSSGHPLLPAQLPPSCHVPNHKPSHPLRPPPSSYPPIPSEVVNPTGRPSSVDSVTLHSALGHEPLFTARNASISRGYRASGVTMVGAASTKLQAHDGEEENSKPQASEADLLSDVRAGQELTGPFGNDSENSHAAPSSMLFSPALPPTPGFHPRPLRDRSRKASMRESQYSTRTTKSYVSSFISRVSAVASGHSVALRSAFRSRTVKPLPPIPTLPHLSVAAEAERRRLEEGLPMPQLVNRADTLAKMLEKGDYPHDRLDPARQEKLGVESLYDNEGSDRRASYAEQARNFPSRDRKPKRRRLFAIASSFNITPHRCRRYFTSKTPRTIIAVCGLALILIVVAVAVGVTVTKKRRSPRLTCAGNITGASCNLSKSRMSSIRLHRLSACSQTRLVSVQPSFPVNAENSPAD